MNAPPNPRGARPSRLTMQATLCLLAAGLLAGCSPPAEIERIGASGSSSRCIEHDGLPDPHCTPGAISAGVPLTAICAFGYSHSVRPPESYTEPLKLAQMRAYRLPCSPSRYEEDHLVPLSIGGAPRDPRNLWPEPRSGPNNAEQKDHLETWAARMACARHIPLGQLRHEMATDWIALYRAAGGERVLRSYPPGG